MVVETFLNIVRVVDCEVDRTDPSCEEPDYDDSPSKFVHCMSDGVDAGPAEDLAINLIETDNFNVEDNFDVDESGVISNNVDKENDPTDQVDPKHELDVFPEDLFPCCDHLSEFIVP